MARYKYKPYRKSKTKGHNILIFAVVVIIVIVAGVMLIRSNQNDSQAKNQNTPEKSFNALEGEKITAFTPPSQIQAEENEYTEENNQPAAQPEPVPTPAPQTNQPQTQPVTVQNNLQPADTQKTEQTEDDAKRLITEAQKDLSAGRIIAARDKLNETLTMQLEDSDRTDIKKILSGLSEKWLFSSVVFPNDTLTGKYKVKPGDNLQSIGDKHNVPYELLMRINNIKRPELLRANSTIKVVNGPFHAIVYKSKYTMDLYLGKKTYVITYRVGLGAKENETPTGTWLVKTDGKLIRPPWPRPQELGGGLIHPDDPEYPLGSRWIGIKGIEGDAVARAGFGIHGTKEPESIGKNSSMGCIRLFNGDVKQLYDMMTPGKSRIKIVK